MKVISFFLAASLWLACVASHAKRPQRVPVIGYTDCVAYCEDAVPQFFSTMTECKAFACEDADEAGMAAIVY